jgi:hypothetical protein
MERAEVGVGPVQRDKLDEAACAIHRLISCNRV